MDEANKSKNGFLFGIRTIEVDRLIGLVELDGIEWPHGVGWLGVGVGESEYWGKATGVRLWRSCCALPSTRFNLHRVQLSRTMSVP